MNDKKKKKKKEKMSWKLNIVQKVENANYTSLDIEKFREYICELLKLAIIGQNNKHQLLWLAI